MEHRALVALWRGRSGRGRAGKPALNSVVATAEYHSSLVTRLMDALVAPPMKIESYLPKRGTSDYYPPEARPPAAPPREELRRLIQQAIVEIAHRGEAVIVAHAASMALAGEKDLLRVLVTGSVRTRAQRLWLTGKLLNEAASAQAVADSDRERQRYLERFFDVREELPTHYDLVINTDLHRAGRGRHRRGGDGVKNHRPAQGR